MNICTNEQIAGVVVLYNPAASVLDNIYSYLPQVGCLYAVDNSEMPDPGIVQQLAVMPGVKYCANGGNSGIACALNSGATFALADGYRYLLTMDQDSRAFPDMVETLSACHGKSVALVAPYLLSRDGQPSPVGRACRPVQTAMTSGSLLDLNAYRRVGPFRDDFFIDFVDIEYCLRLRKHGYKVLQADSAHLEHHVGRRIGAGRFSVITHPPLRKYYKTRNRFQVLGEYGRDFPGYVFRDRIRIVLELARLFLFEEEKLEKLRMMWRGWRDFRQGKFGKYAEQR